MDAEVDVLVVGAGVVGLACAAALARNRAVSIVERLAGVGRETSARNSGVVHAGLYYPPGSLKALSCVEGRRRLYAFCEEHGVAAERCGKLLIATDMSERDELERVAARGRDNGAGALRFLDAGELRRREPALRGVAALWSPESGVVDAEGLVAALRRQAQGLGADLCLVTEVLGIAHDGRRLQVDTRDREGRATIAAAQVVLCAGLTTDQVLSRSGVEVDRLGLRQWPCKGDYFSLGTGAPRPQSRLVYPVPAPGLTGLGIHLTTDLGGRLLAGPDAAYVDEPSYQVDPAKAPLFARAVARYLPGLEAEHLTPDYAGIRPKLTPPGSPAADFVIADLAEEGFPGLVALAGIESPGLTASLALAEQVVSLLPPP